MRTRFLLVLLGALGVAVVSQGVATAIFPLSQVKAGMQGIGRTVFQGDQVATFQVEILGVVQNMGPRQAVIMAKLSGGPLADTGVIEGMSGSPVYIEGKLVGAVALGFPFAKSAIAGITPIEQMIAQDRRAQAAAASSEAAPAPLQMAAAAGAWTIIAEPGQAHAAAAPTPAAGNGLGARVGGGGEPLDDWQSGNLPELQTPLVLSGFTPAAVQEFLPQFEAMGLRPTLGAGGAAPLDQPMGNPQDLHPGEMISVQLMRGDLGVAADGTVTYIDGNQVYAFGHRFLAAGPTALPFSKASVLTLIPGLMTSTKMDTPGQPMGVIHEDLSQGVYGSFGGQAPMIPVRVRVASADAKQPAEIYSFEMVDNRAVTGALMNMALFSTLDATARGLGAETLAVKQTMTLSNGSEITANDLFSSDQGSATVAAAATTRPLGYVYASGLDGIHVKEIDVDITASDEKRVLTLEQVWSDRRTVQPGDTVQVTAILRAPDGAEVARQITLKLPETLTPGDLSVVVGDGETLALMQPSQLPGAPVSDIAQLAAEINRMPHSNEICARVTRPDPAFVLNGERFPSPPPSLARALAAVPGADTDVHSEAASTVVEYRSEPLSYVIAGAKTVHLTVR